MIRLAHVEANKDKPRLRIKHTRQPTHPETKGVAWPGPSAVCICFLFPLLQQLADCGGVLCVCVCVYSDVDVRMVARVDAGLLLKTSSCRK